MTLLFLPEISENSGLDRVELSLAFSFVMVPAILLAILETIIYSHVQASRVK